MTKTKTMKKQNDHKGFGVGKILTLLLITIMTCSSSFANVATSYFFSQGVGSAYTYNGIDGMVLIPTAGVLDDQSFTAQPIGFAFKYDGISYTTFGVNVNGYLKLGSGVVNVDSTQVLAGETNALSALNSNLIAQDAGSNIRYFVSGIAPNRTLTVQWYRFNLKHTILPALNTNPINFQIVLSETTNIIQFKYDAVKGGNAGFIGPLSAQVGITGSVTSDYLIRNDGISPNQWLNSINATSNVEEIALTNLIFPPTDLVYTFTPNVPCAVTTTIPVVTNPCSVTLTWSSPIASSTCSLPDNYKIYVSKNNLFVDSTNMVNGTTQVATTLTLTTLLPNTTYYWKVVPKNSFGEGQYVVNSFTTVSKTPNLVTNPLVNDTTMFANVQNTPSVKLSWTAPVSSCSYGIPTEYKVYLGVGTTTPTLISTLGGTTTSTTTGPLSLNTTYTWKVEAKNAGGTSTSTFTFTTKNLQPNQVVLNSPTNGVYMVSQTPTLIWNAPTVTPYFGAATSYIIYGKETGSIEEDTIPVGNVTSFVVPTPLKLNTNYSWKVAAVNSVDTGLISQTWNFTTTPGQGTLKGTVTHTSIAIIGAIITAVPNHPGYPTVTTISDGGQYSMTLYDTITYTLSAKESNYNDSPSYVVSVIKGGTTIKNIVMTRPEIGVFPATNFIVNVRPGALEYTNLSHYFTIQNIGDGTLTWSHSISTPTPNWLKLSIGETFTLLPSSNIYDSTYFSTVGLIGGNQKTTTVTFTSTNPNVGTFVVPVIMNVTGNAILAATNISTILNQGTGVATLNWNGPNVGYDGFLNFKVLRNGITPVTVEPVRTGNSWTLTEILPLPTSTPVTTFYTIETMYSGGYKSTISTSPSVTYYRPSIYVVNSTIEKTLFPNRNASVTFQIQNIGNPLSVLAINSLVGSGNFVISTISLPVYINGTTTQTFSVFFTSFNKTAGTYTQNIVVGTNVNSVTITCNMIVLPIYPPTNLNLTTTGTPENDIKLTWSSPVGVNSLLGYNVYRSAGYAPTGSNVSQYNWVLVASRVTNLYWIDKDLSNLVTNTYSYKLTAVYTEGESDPTGIVYTQIFLKNSPTMSNDFKMYPNPVNSNGSVELKMNKVKDLYIYNSNGKLVGQKNVEGQTDVTLGVSNYSDGVYTVKFLKENGESFYSRLVIVK